MCRLTVVYVAGVQVPAEPTPFCAVHAESKEEEHRVMFHGRAYRDGWTLVRTLYIKLERFWE